MAVAIGTEPSLAESSQWRACRLGMGRVKKRSRHRGAWTLTERGRDPKRSTEPQRSWGGGDPDRQEGRNGAPRKVNWKFNFRVLETETPGQGETETHRRDSRERDINLGGGGGGRSEIQEGGNRDSVGEEDRLPSTSGNPWETPAFL